MSQTVRKLASGFAVIPFQCVTLNGMPLQTLVAHFESSNAVPSGWALIAPNGRAVDSEEGNVPFRYMTEEEAIRDAEFLFSKGECSTCGPLWKKGQGE